MDKQSQITFDFSSLNQEGDAKEFLSGAPVLQPNQNDLKAPGAEGH